MIKPNRIWIIIFIAFLLLFWVPLGFLAAGLGFSGNVAKKQIKTVFNDLRGKTSDR
jgi:hypothetical protein